MTDFILRRAQPETYKTIGLHHVEKEPRLSWKAVGLLTYMLTRPPDWRFRRGDLVNRHTDRLASVKAGLRELRQIGYLDMRPMPGGGWEWLVSDEPLTPEQWAALPKVDNRPGAVENPTDGKPAGRKSTRLTKSSRKQQEEQEGLSLEGEQVVTSPAQVVFDYWAHARHRRLGRNGTGPKQQLTKGRRTKIQARLDEGYTVEDLKRATDAVLASDFHLTGGHTDVELICRDQKHVEQYLAMGAAPKQPEQGSMEWFNDQIAQGERNAG